MGAWARIPAVGLAALALGPTASGLASGSTLPAKLVGAWDRNVTSGGPIHGVWTMVVKKNGAVDLYTPGGYRPGCIAKHTCIVDFSTTYAVAGSRLNVGGLKGTFVTCFAKATYSWKVAGKSLTLKAIADKTKVCADRVALLKRRLEVDEALGATRRLRARRRSP